MLCGIDRTVLSSRTSETNHQIGESTIHISFYRGVYDMVDMLEEVRDLPVILQELDHWLIQTGEMVVTLVFTGVIIARQSNTNPPPFPLGSFGIPFL